MHLGSTLHRFFLLSLQDTFDSRTNCILLKCTFLWQAEHLADRQMRHSGTVWATASHSLWAWIVQWELQTCTSTLQTSANVRIAMPSAILKLDTQCNGWEKSKGRPFCEDKLVNALGDCCGPGPGRHCCYQVSWMWSQSIVNNLNLNKHQM